MAFLEIRGLDLAMRSYAGEARILNGVDLSIDRGEVWGVVGETGSGKSLTGLSVSRLVPTPPGRYLGGSIHVDGFEVLGAQEKDMHRLRGSKIGMIFQDPTTNLDPAFRIGEQLQDVAMHAGAINPDVLGVASSASRRARRHAARALSLAMLDKVGIPEPAARIDDYPHQFSGGMRQRVLIAMALIGRPELLIADEPTTALDVSVQAQILKLLYGLVRERDLAVMFITHNLGVVAQICSHVAVMFAGRILEAGPVRQIFKAPQHRYTRALLAAVPRRGTRRGELVGLAGAFQADDAGGAC